MSEITDALETIFSADSELYRSRGFMRRVGFGERPALINIDLANAWTREGNPFTCDGMDVIIPGVQRLLAAVTRERDPRRLYDDRLRRHRGAEHGHGPLAPQDPGRGARSSARMRSRSTSGSRPSPASR